MSLILLKEEYGNCSFPPSPDAKTNMLCQYRVTVYHISRVPLLPWPQGRRETVVRIGRGEEEAARGRRASRSSCGDVSAIRSCGMRVRCNERDYDDALM